jgi:hypothetical protein
MAATRSAACATCACRCATLRALEGFADGADYDAFVAALAALAADASLLPAPPLAGAPCTGRVERRLRCADCGAAWRLAEPDPPGRGQWRREPPSGFDALAGDLAALERLLRREDGRTMLPGVRELRRVVESLAAERLSPLDPEAARASSEAGRMLAGCCRTRQGWPTSMSGATTSTIAAARTTRYEPCWTGCSADSAAKQRAARCRCRCRRGRDDRTDRSRRLAHLGRDPRAGRRAGERGRRGPCPAAAGRIDADAARRAARHPPAAQASRQPRAAANDWRFPLVSRLGPAAGVAARINFVLFVGRFDDGYGGAVPPADPRQALGAAGPFARRNLPTLDYRVTRNDARVLAITFTGESCGAYCEDFHDPVAFDARTGRTLAEEDLFEPAGVRAMLVEAARANAARLDAAIARLRREQRAAAARPAPRRDRSLDDHDDAIAMLDACRERWRDTARPDAAASIEIRERELVVRHGRCSNHAMRGLDPIGAFSNAFALERLRPWLSAYGREVLLGEGRVVERARRALVAAPQAWRGTIGDNAVTLFVSRVDDDDRVFGYYFYDRFRAAIQLVGKRSGDRLELRETAPGDEPNARGPAPDGTLSLTVAGDRLTGHWRGGGARGGEIRVHDAALDGAFLAAPGPARSAGPR